MTKREQEIQAYDEYLVTLDQLHKECEAKEDQAMERYQAKLEAIDEQFEDKDNK